MGNLVSSCLLINAILFYELINHCLKELKKYYTDEKERLGDSFVLQEFMDKLLETGAVPLYAIPEILER